MWCAVLGTAISRAITDPVTRYPPNFPRVDRRPTESLSSRRHRRPAAPRTPTRGNADGHQEAAESKSQEGCQPEEEVGRGKGEEKLKRGCRGSEKGEWGWEWGQDKNCSESGMKWTWRLWQTMRGRSIHVGCIKRGIVPHTGAGGRGRGALLPVDYAGFLLPWRERNNELGESD